MRGCRNKLSLLLALVLLLGWIPRVGAEEHPNGVLLFEAPEKQARMSETPWVMPTASYSNWKFENGVNYTKGLTRVGAIGGFPVGNRMDFGAEMYYKHWCFSDYDGYSGLSDLNVFGRYNFQSNGTAFTAGGNVMLPVGSEKVGAGNFQLGAFAAAAYMFPCGFDLNAYAGLTFFEETKYTWNDATHTYDEDKSFKPFAEFGIGGIYPVNNKMSVIGELNFQPKFDYINSTFGVDYRIKNWHLRGGISAGLDEGAADFGLIGQGKINF